MNDHDQLGLEECPTFEPTVAEMTSFETYVTQCEGKSLTIQLSCNQMAKETLECSK